MFAAATNGVHFFRVPADKPDMEGEITTAEKEAAERSPEEEEYIVCRQCRQAITRPVERIDDAGFPPAHLCQPPRGRF